MRNIVLDFRKIQIIGAVFLALFFIFLIGAFYPASTGYDDAEWYIKIAKGDIKDAIQPFASRVLHPLIVRAISSISGFDLDFSFYFVNIFLLTGFIFVISLFFREISFMSPFLALSIIFTPFLLEFHRYFYLSDVPYAFLAAFFFLFLKKKNIALSLFSLFLLFFSRPTDAMVLGVIFLIVSFCKKEMKLVKYGAVIIIIAYLLNLFFIAPLGAPNIHHANNFVYRLLEPPYWFVKSFLGIDWLVNTHFQYCKPRLKLFLPDWLHIGDIKWVGICRFNILNPLSVIFYVLITFGVIPGILFFIGRELPWREIGRKGEIWLLTALVYGICYYFLGALAAGLRTISYAWPAMWLASLFIFDHYYFKQFPPQASNRFVKIFFISQALVSWIPYLFLRYFNPSVLLFSSTIIFSLAVYFIFLKQAYSLSKI